MTWTLGETPAYNSDEAAVSVDIGDSDKWQQTAANVSIRQGGCWQPW